MKTTLILSVILLFIHLAPSACCADCNVWDDFDDGSLGPWWSAPYGGVEESDSVCLLTERGYLNTAGDCDYTWGVFVEVDCQFRWLVSDDSFTIVVRSDGVRSEPDGEVQNGVAVELRSSDGGRVVIDRVINGDKLRLHDSEAPGLTEVGVWHGLWIYDTRELVEFAIDTGDGEHYEGSVNCTAQFPVNKVSFYNSELASATAEIEWVSIYVLSLAVEERTWGQIKALYR